MTHDYRLRVFHPFNVVPELLILGMGFAFGLYGRWWMVFGPLSGVIGLVAGSWFGSRLNPSARLRVSADGLKFGGYTVPWSGLSRWQRRPLILGGDRLVLREPLVWPRWMSLWKGRYVYLSMYERPLDLGADLARWAPHLVSDAAVSAA